MTFLRRRTPRASSSCDTRKAKDPRARCPLRPRGTPSPARASVSTQIDAMPWRCHSNNVASSSLPTGTRFSGNARRFLDGRERARRRLEGAETPARQSGAQLGHDVALGRLVFRGFHLGPSNFVQPTHDLRGCTQRCKFSCGAGAAPGHPDDTFWAHFEFSRKGTAPGPRPAARDTT